MRRVVIGVGNTLRGDDGAGPAVVALLRDAVRSDVEIVAVDGEATELLSLLEGAASAFIIDASGSEGPAGTVRRFDASTSAVPQQKFASTSHGLGVAAVIELARALSRLPPQCVVYTIEGASFEVGAPVSPAVETAAAEVAKRLAGELAAASDQSGSA